MKTKVPEEAYGNK